MILTKISVTPNSKDQLSEVFQNRRSTDSNFDDLINLSDDFDEKKNFISMLSLLESTQTDSLDTAEKIPTASSESLINQIQSKKLSEPLEQNSKDDLMKTSKLRRSTDSNFDDLSNLSDDFDEKKNFISMLSLLESRQTDRLDTAEKIPTASSESIISQIQSKKLSEPLEQNSKEGIYNDIETIDFEGMIIKGQKIEVIEPARNETQKITEQFIKTVKQPVMTDYNYSAEDTTVAEITTEKVKNNTIGGFRQESAKEILLMDFDLVVSGIADKTHDLIYPKRQAEHITQKPGEMNLQQEDTLISNYYHGGMTITGDTAGIMKNEGDLLKNKVMELDSSNSVLNIITETKPVKTFQWNPVSNEILTNNRSFRAELLNQVVEKISSFLKGGQSEIRIDIKPESLGHLLLHVSMNQNLVNVKILAEKNLVKEMIENQVSLLKTELLQLGIKIDKVNVDLLMPGGSDLAFTQNDESGFKKATKEFEARIWQKESGDVEISESDHMMVNERSNSAVNCFA